MDPLLSTFLTLLLMAAVVLGFRFFIRRPRGLSCEDPPGVRTVVTFWGLDPELFCDDREDRPLVGVRLFQVLCDALAARQIGIENRGTIQNAQRAECVVERERFALVLEWIHERWVVGVEWVPRTRAEKRHLALTHQVFAPADSAALRRLLTTLDAWLQSHPKLSHVRWHRKEDWLIENTSAAAEGPVSKDVDNADLA
jgi:hypothetical protein